MLEKLKEVTIEIVITLFFFKLLPNLEGGKEKSKPKQPKQKRWCVFGTLRVGNKWSPVNQITKLLPLMSRKNKMSFF